MCLTLTRIHVSPHFFALDRLAMLWHPDKHPDNQEEAKAKFQVIQKAYDALMSTDEDEIQMQLGGGPASSAPAPS